MSGAARLGDKCGGTIISAAATVTAEGSPLAHIGSQVSTHSHGSHTHTPVVITGSGTVTVEGKPVARLGDIASCNVHSITTSAGTVTVGG